jgi:alpha,alpha-trehalase
MSVILRLALLAFSLAFATGVAATVPDPARTRAYIDRAWNTLTRSMDDCSALADSKVEARPVLYLPAGLPRTMQIDRAATRCNIDVRVLPQAIHQVGELEPRSLPQQGLLYLPNPYVVPGGFFNEMYGWDSYFIILGLIADQRQALARDMVDNFLFQVRYYGGVLNANRTYYLTRSQPPFLGEMIRAVLDAPASFAGRREADAWLAQAYPLALRDYATWTRAEHRAGDTGLARYFDYGAGPVLELQDADYLRGVIRWLLAHPGEDPGFLVKASEQPDSTEAERLKTTSCDLRASRVCAEAWAEGHRLSADYYLGDRAMRESGFDVNFHFGPFAGATHHYAPVGLNSLLYRYELDLQQFALRLGKTDDARRFGQAAAARKAAMDRYLWHPESGLYLDYDFVAGRPAADPYLTTFYPLWAGAASPRQAQALRDKLPLFEHKGGLAMSRRVSGAQWDAPFGWAPTHWLAVAGLDAYGFHDDARRIARKFTATIDRSLADDGTIREKYNMVSGNADVKVSAGYADNVIGFGWSNGVYLKLQQLLAAPATTGAPGDAGAAKGRFIRLKDGHGAESRAFVAGPEDAKAGILIVHDWFGITDATERAVERLGSLGYRTLAVDLYRGESATTHEAAGKLMAALDRKKTDAILASGIRYLERPGRKLATLGFSMGGLQALNANLDDPDAVSATVIVYGSGFDQIEKARLGKLKSPVLAITGSRDDDSLRSSIGFLSITRETNQPFEMYVYPGAGHAYAQPLFNDGRNYDAEATRVTWMLIEDFLRRHLGTKRRPQPAQATPAGTDAVSGHTR